MLKIATFLNVELDDSDIEAIHGVQRKGGGPGNVSVRFNSRRKRDMISQAAKKERQITAVLGSESAHPL